MPSFLFAPRRVLLVLRSLLVLFLCLAGTSAQALTAQTITFGAQSGKTYGAAPFALSPLATATSGLAVTYTSLTPLVCTLSGTTVTIVTAGTCTIAADQAGDATYSAATQVTQNIAIAQASQAITFGAQTAQTFSSTPFALNPLATASSGLTVAYSSTTAAVCTVSGTTVTLLSVGTCTIAANQAGDTNYSAAAQVTQSIVVSKAGQTIFFGAQAGQTYSSTPFALNPLATASSGLAVVYTSTTIKVCTIAGTTVTILTTGTCIIAANQAGNANYNAATQVTQNIIIGQASQSITFGAQAAKSFGVAPFSISPLATASSGLAVSYASTTPTVCTVTASTVTVLAAGTCTLAADQPGNSSYTAAAQVTQNIVIAPGSQTITFGAQTAKIFGAAPFALKPLATASSGLAVSYSSTTPAVCTLAESTVTIVSAGTCTIAADQPGNGNYNAALRVTQDILIAKATQKITFAAQAGQTYGAAPFEVSPLATSSALLPISYTTTTSTVCTVSGTTVTIVAAGTCTLVANQAGNTNYSLAAPVAQNIVIAKAAQTIAFGAQAAQIIGVAPFALSPLATASSSLPVSYSSTTATICSISGTTVTALGVGTCTISASQPGNANYVAATAVTQNIAINSQTVPGAPTLTGITAGFGSANISFGAPAFTGGSPVTGYTATCLASGQATRTATASASASLITVLGLTGNVAYACTVAASNRIGLGSPSAPLPVTPTANYVVPVTASAMTGLWWNSGESGWGMSVTQHRTMIFAGWYTYDAAGAPTWYVMPSCPIYGNACSGDIYAVSGGSSFVAPWNGAGKVLTPVGSGILTFGNADSGTFSFSIDGVAGFKPVSRQIFASGTSDPNPDYSDLWWNPDESGWGVALSQQYETIVAALFGYDNAGKALWYVASNCRVLGKGCSGDLYQVKGGVGPTLPWSGAGLTIAKVGFVEFIFGDQENGVMNFFIDGVAGSKIITRQTF